MFDKVNFLKLRDFSLHSRKQLYKSSQASQNIFNTAETYNALTMELGIR
jgi:hypothetical protein